MYMIEDDFLASCIGKNKQKGNCNTYRQAKRKLQCLRTKQNEKNYNSYVTLYIAILRLLQDLARVTYSTMEIIYK